MSRTADFEIDQLGFVAEDLQKCNPEDDGELKISRTNRYGEGFNVPIISTGHPLVREGSYYTTTVQAEGGTPGTAVAQTTSITSFNDLTGAVVAIQNHDTPGRPGAKRTYVDMIRLTLATAATSATALHAAIRLDNTLRYASGCAQFQCENANFAYPSSKITKIYIGALTLAAASQRVRTFTYKQLRSVIPVIGDSFAFTFGPIDKASAGAVINGTNPQDYNIVCPPLIIEPGCTASLHLWMPALAAAPTWVPEIWHYER